MEEPAPGGGGVFASARRIGTSLAGLLRTRVEIFSLELREEKIRVINLLAWIAAALSLLVAAILLAVGLLAFFLWQRFGYPGVIALVLVAAGAAAALLGIIRRRVLAAPQPFATTLSEIQKDLACLRPPE